MTGKNHKNLRDGQRSSEYSHPGSSKIQVSCTEVCINLFGCARAPVLLRDGLCTVSIQSLATVLTFSFSQSSVPTCSIQRLISLPYSISNIHASHLEIHVSIMTIPYSRRWPFLPYCYLLTIQNQAKHQSPSTKKKSGPKAMYITPLWISHITRQCIQYCSNKPQKDCKTKNYWLKYSFWILT
jgi:hypothetical protein